MFRIFNRLNRPVRNPNHPKKGSSIKVEPIRDRNAIQKIKDALSHKKRDQLLFIMGINTGFRANELLSLKVGQVRHLKTGDDLELKLSKTKSYRRVTLNEVVVETVQKYLLKTHLKDDDWLFPSSRKGNHLRVDTVSTYVKTWCKKAGLVGNYASHTLRKTFGYWQRMANNTPIPLLMSAFGHSTQQQTLAYLGIQNREIADIYMKLEL